MPAADCLQGGAQEQTELVLEATALYADAGILVTPRAPARIAGFFDGLQLVAPGLVAQPWWRPDQPPPETRNLNWGYGALAVKAWSQRTPRTANRLGVHTPRPLR